MHAGTVYAMRFLRSVPLSSCLSPAQIAARSSTACAPASPSTTFTKPIPATSNEPKAGSAKTPVARPSEALHVPKRIYIPQPPSDHTINGVLDPQVAIAPGSTFDDVDSSLASSIPITSGNDHNNNHSLHSPIIDWSSSYHGLSTTPFSPDISAILMAPLSRADIEIKPDGILYLPEIKYRRILNTAFGPGGWGLAPRSDLIVGDKVVTREYALIVLGRFVAQARGECAYFSEETIPTAGEGCKSNALLRCCKDLGIASELWDPRFIREFKKEHCHEVWVEHVVHKKKRQVWKRRDCEPGYPYKLAGR